MPNISRMCRRGFHCDSPGELYKNVMRRCEGGTMSGDDCECECHKREAAK